MIVINNRFNLSVIKRLIQLLYLHYSCKKVVEKSNKENLKVLCQISQKILCQISQKILKASKKNECSWKDLRLMCK